ncbi:LysR family transcriptional regulator [Arenibaculum pallidiluteum]|uniref:LysR family transcriptional regulator n=1 Tax=Arenibaculum pallidiluteum TaxID=2812559 RepID=UPI001A968204|nr:LysR family transcriptional regulator [Arenibaculum pallidiluteum]
MDRLTAIEAFVRVAERGGFTQAAKTLRISRAMVSKHVQDLEDLLGARLLQRTTRRVGLTEAGQVYFERCQRILADLAEADAAVGELQGQPRGTLRLNAPMSFGVLHLAPAIADFTAVHPQVKVDMTLSDGLVDLVEDGYDLAIRIGALADSSLMARRLAPSRVVLCATPAYVDVHGEPREPDELAAHNCLTFAGMRDEWGFDGPAGHVSVRVSGALRANSGEALAAAALRGQGIVRLPTFIVGEDLKAGRLVPLMPGYQPPGTTISALYPHARHLAAKVRSFVDFLVARFGETPEWDAWMP